jgi:hypothetical protein
MCPDPHARVCQGDMLLVFGRESDEGFQDSLNVETPRLSQVPFDRARTQTNLRSILVLGWTRKVPTVLTELSASCSGPLRVQVISTIDRESLREDLAEAAAMPALEFNHVTADYTIPEVLRRYAPQGYDAVLLVGSDRLESGAESDARSIVGCEVLRTCLQGEAQRPRIVIELMDPDNGPLLEGQEVEVLVGPQLLGRALAQVALVPELCGLYDDLFGAGGAELSVHGASEYGIHSDDPVSFGALRYAAARLGHVLLGAQAEGDRVIAMNPPPETLFPRGSEVRVVVAVRTE